MAPPPPPPPRLPWQGYEPVSDADAAAFREKGFHLEPRPLFPPGAIEAAVRGMNMVVRGEEDTSGLTGVAAEPNAAQWHHATFESDELIKLENPQWASREIRALLAEHGARLGELAARLTGASWVQIWHVQLLGKPSVQGAGEGSLVGYHQDRHYHSGDWNDDSEIFTAWIALSDVTEDAGPMRFVDGSQQWGLLDSPEGNNFFGQGLPTQKAALLDATSAGARWHETAAVLPAGGVSIHDDFTIHSSGPNRSGRLRRSLACHMRSDKSTRRGGGGRPALDTLATGSPESGVCPVIYGWEAFEAQRRAEQQQQQQQQQQQEEEEAEEEREANAKL
jgi:ectoine hydroxylase-related dioxygenase (phytanoyl-CoA dioxygenase family)